MSVVEDLKKNPLILLIVLIVAHWVVVSLNQAPGQSGKRFIQIWLLAVFTPVQEATTKTTSAVRNVWNNYFNLRDVVKDNEVLRAQTAQLNTEVTRLREAEKKLASLEALVNWRTSQKYQGIEAEAVGRDANQWFNSVSINRGTFSGIQEGQPVVTPEGLVGRVIYAAPNAARVLLVTDERHGTGAVIGQIAESRVLGVVKGKSNSLCEMKLISGEAKVQVGDTVMTSGQDGVYPKGLVIGQISRLEMNGGTPSLIEIRPGAPLSKLEMVSVLQVTKEQVRSAIDELSQAEKEKLEREKQARKAAPKK